eukprot:1161300-Pelagomonas_calceolata.AAC.5
MPGCVTTMPGRMPMSLESAPARRESMDGEQHILHRMDMEILCRFGGVSRASVVVQLEPLISAVSEKSLE